MNHIFWVFFKCQDFQSRWQFWGRWWCSMSDIEATNCFHGYCQIKANERQSPIILTLQLITFIPLPISWARVPTKEHFSYEHSLTYKGSPDTINTSVLTGNEVSYHSQLHATGWNLYSSSLHPPGPAMQESCDKMPAALLHACQNFASAFAPWITILPYFSPRLSKT